MNLPEPAPSSSLPHTDPAGKIWKKGESTMGQSRPYTFLTKKPHRKEPKTLEKRFPQSRCQSQVNTRLC